MIGFNPYAITTVTDSFGVQSNGFVQGDLLADPAGRFQIAPGVIAASIVEPVFGGVMITERPPATPLGEYSGSVIAPAITGGVFAGFTVFNGTYSLPTTPQSPVPTGIGGNSFNFVRLGTGNRIVVACSSAIMALAGGAGAFQPQQFHWNVTTQQLEVVGTHTADLFTATLLQVSDNGSVVVVDGVTNNATWNNGANVAVIQI